MHINQVNPFTTNSQFKGGPNPRIAKTQMQILLTQDIWAPKLKVKMPESQLEKDTLLEILAQRLKLDRFIRLSNEKFNTKGNIYAYQKLVEENPQDEKVLEIKQEIDKKGNLKSYFNTLDKQIELESNKNRSAIEYFKNIQKSEDEYLSKKLLNDSRLEKFAIQIEKNNINVDGRFSTKELIEIVETGKLPDELSKTKVVKPQLSKKQLLSVMENEYEDLLRKNVNIYEREFQHYADAQRSRKILEENHSQDIKKYSDVKKTLTKIYDNVERKYNYKVMQIADVEVYPIDKLWSDMANIEILMKGVLSEIKNLKKQLSENPHNQDLVELYNAKINRYNELKNSWTDKMKYSIRYENINYHQMVKAGKESEYKYLTDQNPTLKKHVAAFRLFHNNNFKIPEYFWNELLA